MSQTNPQDYINQFNENAQKMFEPWTNLSQAFNTRSNDMSQTNPQDYINQFNENAQKMFEPWTKLNQAFLKNAEMMSEFSLNTIKTYAEMGLENMRQVAEIDSAESAKDFSDKQAEMLNTISQKMLADAKRMTDLGSNMHNEVMQVLSEVKDQTQEQMQANMKKTADQASKTAQEYTENMNKMAEQTTEQVSKAAGQASKTAKEYTENMNKMAGKASEQVSKAAKAATSTGFTKSNTATDASSTTKPTTNK